MLTRSAATGLAVTALVVLLSGCAAEPSRAVTFTPAAPQTLSAEEQAFAAAEETYRAYVDAMNRVDLRDPVTFEDVFAWTTDRARAGAESALGEMHADGWIVSGPSVVTLIEPSEGAVAGVVKLDVCVDVSGVEVVDSLGASVVSPNRSDVQSMAIELIVGESSTGLQISFINGREGEPHCTT